MTCGGPRRSSLRAAGRAAGALVLAATLSGCTSELSTAFEVSSPTTAAVTVTAQFNGDAAAAISSDKDATRELTAVFTDRLGVAPQRSVDEGVLRYSAEVPYDQLAAVADITGVGDAFMDGTNERVTLKVALTAPTALAAAVRTAAAAQPEGDAVAETMLDLTDVVVEIRMPGGIERASTTISGLEVQVHGDVARLARPASSTQAGDLVAVGDPSAPWWPLAAGGSAVVLTAAGVALWWRRR